MDANKHCRVVEKNLVSEDELGMQIGKQGYRSMDEANIDLRSSATTRSRS